MENSAGMRNNLHTLILTKIIKAMVTTKLMADLSGIRKKLKVVSTLSQHNTQLIRRAKRRFLNRLCQKIILVLILSKLTFMKIKGMIKTRDKKLLHSFMIKPHNLTTQKLL
jgi:hypothetical protein